MVSVIEDSESDDLAKCLVRKFKNPHDKSVDDDKFECCVDKKKTVRQFVHIVAQYYNLDVDSFYLTFNSFKTDSTSETSPQDKVFNLYLYIYINLNVLTYYIYLSQSW